MARKLWWLMLAGGGISGWIVWTLLSHPARMDRASSLVLGWIKTDREAEVRFSKKDAAEKNGRKPPLFREGTEYRLVQATAVARRGDGSLEYVRRPPPLVNTRAKEVVFLGRNDSIPFRSIRGSRVIRSKRGKHHHPSSDDKAVPALPSGGLGASHLPIGSPANLPVLGDDGRVPNIQEVSGHP